jgi:hypothetical protein
MPNMPLILRYQGRRRKVGYRPVMAVLHVTNGDSAAAGLRGGVVGDDPVLP